MRFLEIDRVKQHTVFVIQFLLKHDSIFLFNFIPFELYFLELELQFCVMFISSVQLLIQQAGVCVTGSVCWHLLEAHGTGL